MQETPVPLVGQKELGEHRRAFSRRTIDRVFAGSLSTISRYSVIMAEVFRCISLV